MADIGWIDFSPTDRNRVGSVLDLLRPEGMVDELGIGIIRDSLSNEMFPGISTIQTRAKYFFLVPYILHDYLALSPKDRRKKSAIKFLEESEYEIMWQLADSYNHEDGSGVIGITKYKPEKIARRPSAIYWNGLYTYHLIDTKGLSASIFLKQRSELSTESLLSEVQTGDDSLGDDIDAEYENTFGIKVPYKPNWSTELTLDLGEDEAELLRDRILSVANEKLISRLLIDDNLWSVFYEAQDFMEFAKIAVGLNLPNEIRLVLILAHDFSELMYGAHIAYNNQLQHKKYMNTYFENDWESWKVDIKRKMLNYYSFDPKALKQLTASKRVAFIHRFWEQAVSGFSDHELIDKIISNQEAMVKGHKARIRMNKFQDVPEESWIGLKHLEYRFRQVKTILNDIKTGLKS